MKEVQRPNRTDFMHAIVIAANATIVDETEVKKVMGDKTGEDLQKVLKEHNWSVKNIINKESFEAAKKAYKEYEKHQHFQNRKELFDTAFEQAGVEANPRIESTMRTAWPLFEKIEDQELIMNAMASLAKVLSDALNKANKATGDKGKKKSPKSKEA